MIVCSVQALDGGKAVVAATTTGELLVWDLRSALLGSVVEQQPQQHGIACHRVRVSQHCSRLVHVSDFDVLAVAGREQLCLVSASALRQGHLTRLSALPCAASHRCFNALAWDAVARVLVLGCDDGSLLTVAPSSASAAALATPFFDCAASADDCAVLDVASGPHAVYAACSNGTLIAIDRDARTALWRLHMGTGDLQKGPNLPDVTVTPQDAAWRASVVRADASGKWLLAGAGGNGASAGQGGFVTKLHCDTQEAVLHMPMRSTPACAVWFRGSVVCAGTEPTLYQYNAKGGLEMAATLPVITDVWDLAVVSSESGDDDGSSGMLVVAGNAPVVLLVSAVGRQPIVLHVEKPEN